MATKEKERFKTPYGERERYYTEPGNPIQPIYGYEINKYGLKELVQIGETNIYEIIQESLEETKIENILNRVAMGDNTVMRPDGMYADVSEIPKNLIEARQQMQKLENLWNTLDIEIKKKYEMNLDKFISQAGTEDWLLDMGLIKKQESIKIEPTKTNESEAKTE